jgi:hypothetical protein
MAKAANAVTASLERAKPLSTDRPRLDDGLEADELDPLEDDLLSTCRLIFSDHYFETLTTDNRVYLSGGTYVGLNVTTRIIRLGNKFRKKRFIVVMFI